MSRCARRVELPAPRTDGAHLLASLLATLDDGGDEPTAAGKLPGGIQKYMDTYFGKDAVLGVAASRKKKLEPPKRKR